MLIRFRKFIAGAVLIVLVIHAGYGQEKEKVRNIVLMIGDGMGVSQVYAGMTANNGSLNLEKCTFTGFSKTHSASDYITDSGAGGTAISTGYKTYNKAIGVDADTIPRKTILEYAEDNAKASGLVATSQVTHATPASFISHQKERYDYEAIAQDFLTTEIDLFIGGGLKYFERRKDGIDLVELLEKDGYQVIYKLKDLKKVNEGQVAGLLYDDKPPRYSKGRGEMLEIATEKSLEILDQNPNGFFLMIEASQIDWGGHDNDANYVVEEMLDFDRAIGKVLEFAEKDGNTLVIITSDHETGGMGLNNGDIGYGKVEAKFTSKNHTGVMVPVFAYGPGAENFSGIYENTALFNKMMQAFGFSSE